VKVLLDECVDRSTQAGRKDGIHDPQRGRILLQNMTKLTAVARNEQGLLRDFPGIVRTPML